MDGAVLLSAAIERGAGRQSVQYSHADTAGRQIDRVYVGAHERLLPRRVLRLMPCTLCVSACDCEARSLSVPALVILASLARKSYQMVLGCGLICAS